jgi:serine phosphatase RsbU (regulator of sigma subunit)
MSVTEFGSVLGSETQIAPAQPAQAQPRTQQLLHLPTWTRLRVATKQRTPCGRGGDFFEVFQHRDGTVSTVMADVCGNGPSAAASVSDVRWKLRQHLARGEAPGAVLAAVNDWLADHKTHEKFVTAVCARIDVRRGLAEVATAGHLGPFVKRGAGKTESLATVAGMPLGVFASQVYQEMTLELHPEDAIVLVTDGITDRLASASDLLGQTALTRLLAAAPHTAEHICDALLRAGAKDQDATVVVLQMPARHRRSTPISNPVKGR